MPLHIDHKLAIAASFAMLTPFEKLQEAGPVKIYAILTEDNPSARDVPDFVQSLKDNKEEAIQFIAGLLGMY